MSIHIFKHDRQMPHWIVSWQTWRRWVIPIRLVHLFWPSAHWCPDWDWYFINNWDEEWGDDKGTCRCGFSVLPKEAGR